MFLSWVGPRSATASSSRPLTWRYASSDRQIAPGAAMPLKPGGDVDAVAHQIAVALLDHIAEMNANPELNAALGRDAHVGSMIAF